MAAEQPMRVLVVVAHPDDETVGAGVLMRRLAGAGVSVSMAHVTDGAPRNLRDAHAAGFTSCGEYARARRAELEAAMAAGHIRLERSEFLGVPDQETSYQLAPVARRLAALLDRERPDAVLTHPYEGGHPDHDAAAFAVAAAVRLIEATAPAPGVFEMWSYHAADRRLLTASFLPASGASSVVVELTAEERATKKRMLACFATQQHVLRQFGLDAEAIRRAPGYDFTEPPHAGQLFYERFDWGIDGSSWRDRAREALRGFATP